MEKIRNLKAEEIEVRVAQVTQNGVQLLLYKDSRCDKRILDETFGINGWKNRYEEIKGNLFCTISIWDEEKKQWIDKCDCGVESFSEKEKGEASDAFKRAGFNVGIGRELYTRIFYFASVPTKDNGKGKYEMVNKYEKFTVVEITIDKEKEKITKIKIANSKGDIVFSYGYETTPLKKKVTKKLNEEQLEEETEDIKEKVTDEQIKLIQTLITKVEKSDKQIFKNFENKAAKENLYKSYKVKSSKELTKTKATEMIDLLKKKLGE